jgi:hypothetical protein
VKSYFPLLAAHTEQASTVCALEFAGTLIRTVAGTGTDLGTRVTGVRGSPVPSGQFSRLLQGSDCTILW